MKSSLNFSRLAGALLVSAAAFSLAIVSTPQAKAADFSGKRVTIIVPFSEGGGTDI